jgi:(p)ppGpp synthase/HD superfamily hydrolase
MPSRIEMAAAFARAAHQAVGQKRKYSGAPYWTHLTAVAAMVRQVDGATEDMVIAAYLHDVLEDTQVAMIDISMLFGADVLDLVHALTDQFSAPHYGNRAYRKSLEAARLATVSPDAQTIKYADLIDNTSSIVAFDPGFAQVYLPEAKHLLSVMHRGDPGLRNRALRVVEEAEARLMMLPA